MEGLMKYGLLSMSAALVLFGCGGAPVKPTPDLANANFGPSIATAKFENIVRGSMDFLDPYSAVVNCQTPRKGWYGRSGWGSIEQYYYGWMASCTYNAKNRMGGYVGEKKGVFLIYGDRFRDITDSLYKGYAE